MLVVGTGTEVGKTEVGCAIARVLRESGRRVVGLKPIESGRAVSGSWGDAERLSEAAGGGPGAPCFGFERPVSPHLEARRAGTTIDVGRAVEWVRSFDAEVRVVETAGGLLSPLGVGVTNLDLVLALGPSKIVLVARDGLGVLHDVSSVRWVMRDAGLWARTRVVLSDRGPGDDSTGSNAAELVALGISSSVTVWPRGGAAGADWRRWASTVGAGFGPAG